MDQPAAGRHVKEITAIATASMPVNTGCWIARGKQARWIGGRAAQEIVDIYRRPIGVDELCGERKDSVGTDVTSDAV
jgi:hypothetical protein